jgi:hypothetical protein
MLPATGRLRQAANSARICPRRGRAGYPEYNDCSGPDVALRPRRTVDDPWNGDVLSGTHQLACNVGFWHLADIPSCTAHVRFWG